MEWAGSGKALDSSCMYVVESLKASAIIMTTNSQSVYHISCIKIFHVFRPNKSH